MLLTKKQNKEFLSQDQIREIKISEIRQARLKPVLTRYVHLDKSPLLLLGQGLNSSWPIKPCVSCPFQSRESLAFPKCATLLWASGPLCLLFLLPEPSCSPLLTLLTAQASPGCPWAKSGPPVTRFAGTLDLCRLK